MSILHLKKLCVGIRDIEHLRMMQLGRLIKGRDGEAKLWHRTRNAPRRMGELLNGGSLYWVIGGFICARQMLKGNDSYVDENGIRRCLLLLDGDVIPTMPKRHRPFQGWRYLEAKDAPPDSNEEEQSDNMPFEMAQELRELGLL
ncbi:MAG: DUF1489 domain-containing protein [Pseudomonadota bacterium]|nr:DUF1489 domain-containing protein [Pseudomonadota bacterium]